MTRILLTGAMRSGTTLLEKLLSSHPKLSIYSQPLPLLYVEVKRSYLDRHGQEDGRYPLADQFLTTFFPTSAFQHFLRDDRISSSRLRKILTAQMDYSGCRTDLAGYSPPEGKPALDLARSVESILDWLQRKSGAADEVVGSKEVFCEEFIPYFLDQGYRVVQILRDPRDVLASALAGEGGPDIGKERPLLFLIRQWRKSVAYALEHREHGNFYSCRFEDLIADPNSVLDSIYDFLRLRRPPRLDASHAVVDQNGVPWNSNSSYSSRTASSHRGLDPRAIGSFHNVFNPNQIRFLEALALPEMLQLSYESSLRVTEVEHVLSSEPEDATPPARPELAGYRWCATRCAEEIDRWRRLQAGEYLEEAFSFPRSFDALRLQVGGSVE